MERRGALLRPKALLLLGFEGDEDDVVHPERAAGFRLGVLELREVEVDELRRTVLHEEPRAPPLAVRPRTKERAWIVDAARELPGVGAHGQRHLLSVDGVILRADPEP